MQETTARAICGALRKPNRRVKGFLRVAIVLSDKAKDALVPGLLYALCGRAIILFPYGWENKLPPILVGQFFCNPWFHANFNYREPMIFREKLTRQRGHSPPSGRWSQDHRNGMPPWDQLMG
jgi:hypothetical protein